MYQQNQIPRQLRSASGLEQLQSIMATRSFTNRTELTHAVCEEFGFYDARGKAQVTSSLRVLRDLEQTGRIELPASSRSVPQHGKPHPGMTSSAGIGSAEKPIWHGS